MLRSIRTSHHRLALASGVFVLAVLIFQSSASAYGMTVTIPDAGLEFAVRDELNKPSGDITDADMQTLTSITTLNRQIHDLTGLEYATNLSTLSLQYNQITDIRPIAGLTNLTRLTLGHNEISDISPVAGLTNLTDLNLEFNQIADITPVGGLTKLVNLFLNDNQIVDITPVAGLTQVTCLLLDNNQVSDITPVAGLANRLYLLTLNNNQVVDISPVAGLTKLGTLSVENNLISDIPPLPELTRLSHLYIGGNQITDITPLLSLTSAWVVRVVDNYLDLVPGSPSTVVIQALRRFGATVESTPQKQLYEIIPTADAHGLIVPGVRQAVVPGRSSDFAITPEAGYHIADVAVDGVSLGPITNHSFTNVMASHTITATFALNTYAVLTSASAGGSVTPGALVDHGGSFAFTVVPQSGYHIADVRIDGVSIGASPSGTLNDVTTGHFISATFEPHHVSALTLLSGSAPSLGFGMGFGITGTCSAEGTGVVGRTVVLQSASPGGLFTDTSSAATVGEGGTFSFSVKPTTRTYYRVRFAGDAECLADVSVSVCATPKVRLARLTSWSRLAVSKTYYAAGYIGPKHSAGDANKVRIRAYRRASDGTYRYVKSFAATYSAYSSTASRYKAAVKLPSKGYWKLVAYHAADSGNAGTLGSADYVLVK